MPYLASELVAKALYTSGLVSRMLQKPTADQASDGLDMLNEILSFQSADSTLVPYYDVIDFVLEYNVEQYFLENVIAIDLFTWNLNSFRFETARRTRFQYFGTPRPENVQSIPTVWRPERTKGGTNLFVYFKPAQAYPAQILAKSGFTDVNFNTDLEEVYDLFYISYLRHKLARYICMFYRLPINPAITDEIFRMEKILRDLSPPDLTVKLRELIQPVSNDINWGDANIGRGWRP